MKIMKVTIKKKMFKLSQIMAKKKKMKKMDHIKKVSKKLKKLKLCNHLQNKK